MEFDESHKVILKTLKDNEASAFNKFLWSEIARHEIDIEQARQLIIKVRNKFGIYD